MPKSNVAESAKYSYRKSFWTNDMLDELYAEMRRKRVKNNSKARRDEYKY